MRPYELCRAILRTLQPNGPGISTRYLSEGLDAILPSHDTHLPRIIGSVPSGGSDTCWSWFVYDATDGTDRWYGAQKYLDFQGEDRYAGLLLHPMPRRVHKNLLAARRRSLKRDTLRKFNEDLRALDVVVKSFAQREYEQRHSINRKKIMQDHETAVQQMILKILTSHFARIQPTEVLNQPVVCI